MRKSFSSRAFACLIGTLLAVAVLAAACGDDDDGGAVAEPGDAAATTEDAAATTEALGEVAGGDGTVCDGNAEEATVNLSVQTSSIPSGWFHLAKDLGYFEDVNLEVPDIVQTRDSSVQITGALGGSLDILITGSEPMAANEQGANMIAIAAISDAPVWSVVSAPELEEWAQLAGTTVGVSGLDTISTTAFRMAAEEAGLDPDNFDYVVVGGTSQRLAALQSGQVEVVSLVQPADYLAEQEGFNNLGFGATGAPVLSTMQVTTSRQFAENNEEVVVRAMCALQRTVDYTRDEANRDDVVERLSRLLEVEPDAINASLDLLLDTEGFLPADLHISEEAHQNVGEAMVEHEALSEVPPFNEYVDHSYLEQAQAALEDND